MWVRAAILYWKWALPDDDPLYSLWGPCLLFWPVGDDRARSGKAYASNQCELIQNLQSQGLNCELLHHADERRLFADMGKGFQEDCLNLWLGKAFP